jgi:hypothetical protein
MLAIYMPIIREAAMNYRELWNIHRIRLQPNRPNSVAGQPEVLYEIHDGVNSYGVPINKAHAQSLQESLGDWG